jgi:HEAT repeat protein
MGCGPTERRYEGRTLKSWSADLKHKDAMARWRAAGILAINGVPKEAIPDLIDCLKDPKYEVRWEACIALGKARQNARAAIPALIENLTYWHEGVRNAAGNTLKKIDLEAAIKAGVE